AMSARITAPVVIFACVSFASQAARAAEPLTVEILKTRLASHPTGDAARALADDVRAWFGKDRTGRLNVLGGGNPKGDGLNSAWAIEAEQATAAAVKTADGNTIALARIGDTPIFAATAAFPEGTGLRWSYVINDGQAQKRGDVEFYADPPELRANPDVPRGKL